MYTYLGTGAISVAAIATWRVALRACLRPADQLRRDRAVLADRKSGFFSYK